MLLFKATYFTCTLDSTSLDTQGQCSYNFPSPSYYKMFSLHWVISKNIQTGSNNSHLKGGWGESHDPTPPSNHSLVFLFFYNNTPRVVSKDGYQFPLFLFFS